MEPKELKIKIKVDKTELDEAIASARELQRILDHINEFSFYDHQDLAPIIAAIPQEERPKKKSLRTRLNNWMYEDHPILYIGVLIFAIIFCIFAMVVLILKVLLLK